MVKRRTFLKSAGVTGTAGLAGIAGCVGNLGGVGGDDEADVPFDGDPIEFRVSPTEGEEQMRQQYEPFQQWLAEYIDEVDSVNLEPSPHYAALLNDLERGIVDFGETGPLATALGVQNDHCEVILQRYGYGSWTYSSVIVTTEEMQEEHGLEDLTDLEGKTIAFADTLSASGSLFPLAMLSQAGLSVPEEPGDPTGADFTPSWSGHTTAFETLQQGDAAAAGVGRFVATRDLEAGEEPPRPYVDNVVELDIRDGIPRAPFVASPDLSEEEKELLIEAFENAEETVFWGGDDEEGTEDDPWFGDVRRADNDAYDLVVETVEELGYGENLL